MIRKMKKTLLIILALALSLELSAQLQGGSVSVGKDKAVRAVAGAIGANGISILIPCHRVIGSDKSLTGYAGGLEAKKMLLQIETQI